jgi:hypothetical protein
MAELISGNRQRRRAARLAAIGIILSLIIALSSFILWPVRNSARVEVNFSHFENVPGGRVAVFQVSNTGRRPVTVYGPRGTWPDWLILRYDGTNWDSSYTPSGDFGFSKPIVLPPSAKIAMPTFLPGLESWVVGVAYSTAPYARLVPAWLRRTAIVEKLLKTRMKAAWSEPITLAAKPTNIVPPLGSATNQLKINGPMPTPPRTSMTNSDNQPSSLSTQWKALKP